MFVLLTLSGALGCIKGSEWMKRGEAERSKEVIFFQWYSQNHAWSRALGFLSDPSLIPPAIACPHWSSVNLGTVTSLLPYEPFYHFQKHLSAPLVYKNHFLNFPLPTGEH